MNPHLLRTFVAAARSGSITKAATTLGITQPAASGQIQALETQFGRPLLVRKARGVELTAIGEELLREVANHFEAIENSFERLKARSSSMTGTVRFGGPTEFTSAQLPPVFSTLAQHGIDLRITLGGREKIYQAFADESIDIGITASEPQSNALGFTPLIKEELLLVAAPVVAERYGRKGLTAKTFTNAEFVAYDEALPLIRTYAIAVFDISLDTIAKITVPNLAVVRDILIAGTGISILPRYLCDDQLIDGKLVELHKPKRPIVNQLFLVWRKEALRLPRVAFVREQCREMFSSSAP